MTLYRRGALRFHATDAISYDAAGVGAVDAEILGIGCGGIRLGERTGSNDRSRSCDTGTKKNGSSWSATMKARNETLPGDAERGDKDALCERDLRLVRRAVDGDRGSLDELSRRLEFVPKTLASLNLRLGYHLPSSDIADLAQDTVIKILAKLSHYEGRGRFVSWVHRICFLELMNYLRTEGRRSRIRGVPLDTVAETLPAPERTTIADYESLLLGLDELGPPESDIIRMKHFDSATFEEIGAILRISSNTAKTRYYRGIAWMRRHLTRRNEGEQR